MLLQDSNLNTFAEANTAVRANGADGPAVIFSPVALKQFDWSSVNDLSLLDAALTYARNGFKVHPLTPGDKTPLTWWPVEATTDPIKIRKWWTQWPDANIGLVMGNGFHALDIDNKNGQDGIASYLAAGGTPTWMAEQPTQTTPSGGLHLLFRSDESFKNFTHQGRHRGIDMRSDGGYIAVAPSRTPEGVYAWEAGDISAPLPDALLASVRALGERSQVRITDDSMPTPTEFTEEETNTWIDRLGTDHARFLRTGESASGDRSKQAFLTALVSFKAGWLREDMAAIGPYTVLATFGADPPHGASDPWHWCWKYHIEDAWEAAQKELARLDPSRQFEVIATEQKALPVAQRKVPKPDDYDSLKAIASGVATEEMEETKRALLRIARADIGEGEAEALITEVKKSSNFALNVLRPIYKDYREERQQEIDARKTQKRATEDVLVLEQDKVYGVLTCGLVRLSTYITHKAREFGGDRAAADAHYLSGTNAACRAVNNLTYDPGKPHGIVEDDNLTRFYNTYRPSSLVPVAGSVAPWLNLLHRMAPGASTVEKTALLNYFAHSIQRPGIKVNYGLLLGGDHGIGKDSFLQPIWKAAGEHNVNHVNADTLHSDFNGGFSDAKFLDLQEIAVGNSHGAKRIAHKLKNPLCAPPETLRINRKGLEPYDVPNLIQIVATTNERHAVHQDRGERRWLSVWCDMKMPPRDTPERLELDQTFVDFYQWVCTGGDAHVLHFLLNRDLSEFNPTAAPIHTSWDASIVDLSESPIQSWLKGRIEACEGLFRLPVISVAALRTEMVMFPEVKDAAKLTDPKIAEELKAAGAEKWKTEKGNLWIIRPEELNVRTVGFWWEALKLHCRHGLDNLFDTKGELKAADFDFKKITGLFLPITGGRR